MEIFSYIMLWVLAGAVTGWAWLMFYMIMEQSVDGYLNKKGISYESVPALMILATFIWPISLPILVFFTCWSFIGGFLRMAIITFKSLYGDLRKIIKKE